MNSTTCTDPGIKTDASPGGPGLDWEIKQLKDKLQQMTEMCHQLLEHISRLESNGGLLFRNKKTSDTQVSLEASSEVASGIVVSESETWEVARLKEKLQEVVQMNVNWQNYHSQREKLVNELTEKLTLAEKALERKSSEACSGSVSRPLPESQQIEFDRLLLIQKHKVQEVEEEKLKILGETVQHKGRIQMLEQTILERDSIIQRLQESLDAQRNASSDQERLTLLEAQLLMFREDFESERKDRERAQHRIAVLEEELAKERRKQVYGHNYNYPVGRGGGTGVYQTDRDEIDGDVVTDSVAPPAAPTSLHTTAAQEDVLKCPNCMMSFPADEHYELLNHMGECDAK